MTDPTSLIDSPGFIGGFIGSLVALRWVPGQTWAERACNVAAGTATAAFGAPGLLDFLHVVSPSQIAGFSFAVGAFGLSLAAALMQGLRELKVGEILAGWLGRR